MVGMRQNNIYVGDEQAKRVAPGEYGMLLSEAPLNSPIFTPTPRPTTLILLFQGVFDIVYDEYCFDYDLDNGCKCGLNKNFYNDGYYRYYEYSTPAPHPTPQIMLIFNKTGHGIPRNDISKGVFGVYLCESIMINEISFGMSFFGKKFWMFSFCW